MIPNYDFGQVTETAFATLSKTNAAALAGMEKLSTFFLDLTRQSIEDSVAAGKELAAAKTPVEFFQLQTKLAQGAFQSLVGESKKASTLTLAVVKDVTAPVADQFKQTVSAPTKKAA